MQIETTQQTQVKQQPHHTIQKADTTQEQIHVTKHTEKEIADIRKGDIKEIQKQYVTIESLEDETLDEDTEHLSQSITLTKVGFFLPILQLQEL